MADEGDEHGGSGSPHRSLDSPLFTPPASPSARRGGESDCAPTVPVARPLLAPPIEGLLYFPHFLSDGEAQQLVHDITQCNYFDVERGRDQAVLFGARDGGAEGLPRWATSLLTLLEQRLRQLAPDDDAVETVLSPRPASACQCTRQFILNVYRPGQGIAAHVDLPHRFLDGIVILSFGHGIAMDFARQHSTDDDTRSIYLLPRSLCVLTGESRWQWTHGIAARTHDLLEDASTTNAPRRIERGPRLSITVRWLKIEQDDDDNHFGPDGSTQPGLRV